MFDSETLTHSLDIPTYPDQSILDKLSAERKFWTSRDCTLHVESQNQEKTIAYGTVEFDPVRDLGFSGDPNAIENLIWFLGKGKLFSTRSVLMQSLQGPVFARPQVNEKGIFSIPTRLFSLNDVPVNVPRELTLGRWYFPGSAVRGQDLDTIARSSSVDPELQIDKSIIGPRGALYDEVPNGANPNDFSSQSLAFSVPLDETYLLNEAAVIDLDAITHLTRENRDKLGLLLEQRQVSKEELQRLINRSNSLYYVGQTRSEFTVPEDIILQINMGYHRQRGEHLLSPLIDPKYHGRVRTEAHSSPGQILDRVQFGAFRKSK